MSQSRSPGRAESDQHDPPQSGAANEKVSRVKFVELRARKEKEEGSSRKSALRAEPPAPPGEVAGTRGGPDPHQSTDKREASPVRSVKADGEGAKATGKKGKSQVKGFWKGKRGKGKAWAKGPKKGSGKSG